MIKDKEVKSNRDRYAERLKSKYPDKDFSDEEALFGQINDDYDDYDEKLSKYQEQEKALSELFASNPRSAAFLIDWRKGEDPIVGMLRKYGKEFKEALEDPSPENLEALAQANKEYADRVAASEKYEEEYRKNIEDTFKTLAGMEEEGYSEEELDQAMNFLVGIMRDGTLGKFARESITMALKAINHDSDVELADREGEVRGRNSKIEEKLRKSQNGDTLPDLAGKHGTTGRMKPKTMFDLAQEAM